MTKVNVSCANEKETARLAESLALALRRGDLVALDGDLGAGKTTLARSLIRAAAHDDFAEVPSPTFTLIQLYPDLPFGSLTHIDLYRIEDSAEALELGMEEALEMGVVLVEWPQKGRGHLPEIALNVEINQGETDDGREFRFTGNHEALKRLSRSLALRKFLDVNGHGGSRRYHLTGDASTRSYETIEPSSGRSVIAMNAPTQPDGEPIKNGKPYSQIARLAEDMHAFVGVGQALNNAGFRSPEIYAYDLKQGYLLIENLGTGQIIDNDRQPIPERYRASIETLAVVHNQTWNADCPIVGGETHTIPPFDREAMLIEVDLLAQWYAPYKMGRALTDEEARDFDNIWNALIDLLEQAEKSLVLRDFHSPNIIWMEEAAGTNRIGIIDFQDALIGPTAYDVASIAQDARVDIPTSLETELVDLYCSHRTDFKKDLFRQSYAIMAAERATKVLGIFVRLHQRDGKDAYLAHLPRIEDYLNRSFAHPVLADYRTWVENTLNQ